MIRTAGRGPAIALGLCALLAAVMVGRAVGHAPAVIVLAAALPATGYAALLLLLDRRERAPALALVVTFLGGAVLAAPLSAALNERLAAYAAAGAHAERVRALLPIVAGPVVEEGVKAAVLVLVLLGWRQTLNGLIAGILDGALVGVGFAMAENLDYLTLAAVQGGHAGLVSAIYVRALLGGLNHAAFTAMTGAGIGYARAASSTRRYLAPVAGFAAAVGQHVAWNALGSRAITAILCNAAMAGGACREPPGEVALFVRIPLVVAASIGPGAITLLLVARAAARRAQPRGGRA